MRSVVLALLLAVPVAVAVPLAAQDRAPPPGAEPEPGSEPGSEPEPGSGSAEEGFSLIEEGARMLFRGLVEEMEPAMRDMAEQFGALAREAEPMLRELARLMEDVRDYHAPEMLPNGDIIIRKRQPGEPPGPQFGPEGETEI